MSLKVKFAMAKFRSFKTFFSNYLKNNALMEHGKFSVWAWQSFAHTSWQIYFTHHGMFSYYIMEIFIPFYLPWNFYIGSWQFCHGKISIFQNNFSKLFKKIMLSCNTANLVYRHGYFCPHIMANLHHTSC
ncbi:hypothetical protein VPH35_057664 [Triticum aestivum]